MIQIHSRIMGHPSSTLKCVLSKKKKRQGGQQRMKEIIKLHDPTGTGFLKFSF